MIEDHPDGPLPKLRGISRFPAHDSILSRFGVSGKPGAVHVNHQILGQFGEHTLTQISWKEVRDWLAKKDASAKTKGNILSVLRTALDDAVEDELLDANPLAGKKMRRKGETRPKKDEIDPFSAEERAAILEAAKDQERNFIAFAFWTGLRFSELCALDWGDVDWVNKRIYVQRALTQHSTTPEVPKTAAGQRYVKLLPAALEALKAQKAFTFMEGEEIFRNPRTGKRWSGDMVIRQRMWKRILLRGRGALPLSLPDAPHLRLDDASGGGVGDVGFPADGPHRLGLHGPDLQPVGVSGCAGSREPGGAEVGVKCGPKSGPNPPQNTPKLVSRETLSA
jgi:integrase